MSKELRVFNLTKYFGKLHVLDNVSFTVGDEICCMVGPTGCGKSTTLNIISGLIPPTRGEVLLGDERIDPRHHRISYVFQEETIFPFRNVRENIEFGLEVRKISVGERKKATDEMIELLHLKEYEHMYPKALSAAIRQLVILGRAFITRPDILLMDEPYGNFDPKTRSYLEDLVVNLRKEFKCPLLFVTHNVEEAVYLGDKIIVLSQKPARIKREIKVDLPRPRDISDQRFTRIVGQIIELIKWW